LVILFIYGGYFINVDKSSNKEIMEIVNRETKACNRKGIV
jgi:hypothetical protein